MGSIKILNRQFYAHFIRSVCSRLLGTFDPLIDYLGRI